LMDYVSISGQLMLYFWPTHTLSDSTESENVPPRAVRFA
jgi:hypothetical protein